MLGHMLALLLGLNTMYKILTRQREQKSCQVAEYTYNDS